MVDKIRTAIKTSSAPRRACDAPRRYQLVQTGSAANSPCSRQKRAIRSTRGISPCGFRNSCHECPARYCWSASGGLFRVTPSEKRTPRPHARVESGFPLLTERTSPPHNRSTEVPGREVERTPTRTASITLHPTDRTSTELGLTRECVTSDTPFHPATREPGPALAKPDPGMQTLSPVRERDATGPENSRDSPGLGANSTKISKCLPPFCLARAGRTPLDERHGFDSVTATNTAQRTRSFEDRGLNHAGQVALPGTKRIQSHTTHASQLFRPVPRIRRPLSPRHCPETTPSRKPHARTRQKDFYYLLVKEEPRDPVEPDQPEGW
jgi:hypothetical protein